MHKIFLMLGLSLAVAACGRQAANPDAVEEVGRLKQPGSRVVSTAETPVAWAVGLVSDVANWARNVSLPTDSPIVFNASRTIRGGDIAYFQGANFGTDTQAWLNYGTPDAQRLDIVNRVSSIWLAVQVPRTIPPSGSIKLFNGKYWSVPVALNAPAPLHLDSLQINSGARFRLFGRNLLIPGMTPTVTINGANADIDVKASDEHMLIVKAPPGLKPGGMATILVKNGSGAAAALDRDITTDDPSGDPFELKVGWAGSMRFADKVIDAQDSSQLRLKVACDNSTDDSAAIQGAIDRAASQGGGVVLLPKGTCRLRATVNMKASTVLQGSGMTDTVLMYSTNYPISARGLNQVGLRDLTLKSAGSAEEGLLWKNNTHSFIQRVNFDLGRTRQMFLTSNVNFVVMQSKFTQTASLDSQGPYIFAGCVGMLFIDNQTTWAQGAPNFNQVHDAALLNNHFSRDATDKHQTSVIHGVTLNFAHRIAIVSNKFDVINGRVTDKNRNDGETLLSEGGGAVRTGNTGMVARASSTSLTPVDTEVNAFYHTASPGIVENYGIAIVSGTGTGQTRRMTTYVGRSIGIDLPWDQIPDTSSRFATFVWGLEKATLKNNQLSGNPRGIWLYQSAVRDLDIVGNVITDGGGIFLRANQRPNRRQFDPIYNVLIADNRISNNRGDWMSHVSLVHVIADGDSPGLGMLGIEVRGNVLEANKPNVYSTVEDYAGVEGFVNALRVEGSDGVDTGMPSVLGTIYQGNRCSACDVAFRLGAGSAGTVIEGAANAGAVLPIQEWATIPGNNARPINTVIR